MSSSIEAILNWQRGEAERNGEAGRLPGLDVLQGAFEAAVKAGVVKGSMPQEVVVYSAKSEEEQDILRHTTAVGEIVFDPVTREVIKSPGLPEDHEPVRLPPTQARIFEQLILSKGIVTRYEKLYRSYNPKAATDQVIRHSVTEHVGRLKRRLGGDIGIGKEMIETVSGVGYKLTSPRKERAA